MAKKMVLVLLVLAALAMGSCATYATLSGVTTPLGMLTSASVNESRGEVIAEYTVILGLVTSDYEQFLEKTKGIQIDIIDVNYFNLFRKVQAVPRN